VLLKGGSNMGQITMNVYIKHLQARYAQANRKRKTELLTEYSVSLGVHRKSLIRLLKRVHGWRDKKPGKKPKYDPKKLTPILKEIWLATNQMCSKRLKVALPLWLPFYKERSKLEPDIESELLLMSERTIDRLLKPVKGKYPKRLPGTRPGSILKKHIPINTNQWNESEPGFVETDTVAHCGTSLLGSFIWSITLTDIYSGWTENAAVWNKGAHGVLSQIKLIEKRLPFLLKGFDSDNGSEFLNHHLIKYFQNRNNPIQFTRSRPYHKGDNAHVEQKNWTHVRQLLGYYRLDNPQLVPLINDLYQNEFSLLQNYFCPIMKLKDKTRIGSRIKKYHDKPKTPFQRLLESNYISKLQKEKLYQTFNSLNPFELRENIETKLKKIFSQVDLKLRKKIVSF
jgi:hypothetical protein